MTVGLCVGVVKRGSFVAEEAGTVGAPPTDLDVPPAASPEQPAKRESPAKPQAAPTPKPEPKLELTNPLFATSEGGRRPS